MENFIDLILQQKLKFKIPQAIGIPTWNIKCPSIQILTVNLSLWYNRPAIGYKVQEWNGDLIHLIQIWVHDNFKDLQKIQKNETDKIRQGRGLPEWQMPPLQIPQPSASLSRHHPSHPHHHNSHHPSHPHYHTRHHHNTYHGLQHHHHHHQRIDCHYGFNLSLAKNSWQSPWLLISTKNDSNHPAGPANVVI